MVTSSSTSSSETRPDRGTPALAFRWLLLVCLLTVVGFELGVRTWYRPPAPMRDKAEAYAEAPHGDVDELVILGTCLPEAIILPDLLAQRMGGNMRIHNLATPAGTARLWVLFLRHHVPDAARIRALLIPYGATDLTKLMAPWESQAMELATWSDLPDMVDWACKDTSCALELTLRKGYRTYRHRGYFANWFWQALGTRAPIPGSMLSPGEVDPSDRLEASPDPGPRAGKAGEPGPGDAGPPGPEVEPGEGTGEPAGRGAGLGWSQGPVAVSDTDPSRFVYLNELLALTAEQGIPVFFTPLPTRDKVSGRGGGENPEYRKLLIETIEGGGGRFLDLATIPGLSAQHFEDDVHLTTEGRQLVTVALGDAMARELSR